MRLHKDILNRNNGNRQNQKSYFNFKANMCVCVFAVVW